MNRLFRELSLIYPLFPMHTKLHASFVFLQIILSFWFVVLNSSLYDTIVLPWSHAPLRKAASYSLSKKEWICSLFKEWILEKSEIRVNLEGTFVLFTHLEWPQGSLGIPEWSLRSLQMSE